jgi:hypothetical protein
MDTKIRELIENTKEKNLIEEKSVNLSTFSDISNKNERLILKEIQKYKELIETILIIDKNLELLENKEKIFEILNRLHEIQISADEINVSHKFKIYI